MHITCKTCIGVAVCATTAALIVALLRDGGEIRFAAPAMCIPAAVFIAQYCGRVAAFFGSVVASVILALFLFPPFGSLNVEEPVARVMLTVCQLSSFCVVLISSRQSTN